MVQAFLLDNYSFKDEIKKLWKNNSPKIYYLFATTELDHYKEDGPILVTGQIDALLKQCEAEPEEWPGLLLNTQASEEQLLTHLRNLLFVTYPPESKGVQTYYDKHTATYLFKNTEPELLSQWLGPIQQLKWYGGTWQQEANQQLEWQEINNISPKVEPAIKQYASLTPKQQQGFSIARQEQYAYDWAQDNEQNYDATYQYLQEAIRLGFEDLEYLPQYLTLRAQHPNGLTPVQLSAGTAEQRLQDLTNFWHTNKEI